MSTASLPSSRPSRPLLKTAGWVFAAVVSAVALWPALRHLFSASFLPHMYCYLGNTGLAWLHVVSDTLIGLSYVAISATLVYLLRRLGRDVPFQWIFVAFGVFIVACGFTHFMEVVTVWKPLYWLAGEVKVVTAIASVVTAVLLPPMVPRVVEAIRADKAAEDRRHAEEALRYSEAKLQGIIESAMDAIITVDRQQKVVIFNAAAETMFRCPAGEAIGAPLDRFIPARFRERHRHDVDAFGRTGVTSRGMGGGAPLAALRADGEEFPIEASISQVALGDDRLFTVIIRDVTERTRAEKALRRSEEQFRTLADSVPQLASFADPGGRVTWYNRRWREFTGLDSRQLLAAGWESRSRPDMLPAMEETWSASMRSGEPFEMVLPLRAADGSYRQFLSRVVPLHDDTGAIFRWVGTHTDITELHDAEQALRASEEREREARRRAEVAAESVRRLQALTEAALAHLRRDDLLVELLHRLRGLMHADTIAILLKSETAETLVLRAALGLGGDTLQGIDIPIGSGFSGQVAQLRRALATDDVSQVELLMPGLRESGVRSLLGVPLIIEGELIGVVHVGTHQSREFTGDDIDLLQFAADRIAIALDHSRLYDAEVRARQELEARTQEVERLNAELERRVQLRTSELQLAVNELEAFSYSVSHDLRAPLRSIDGFSQILLEDYEASFDAQGKDYLRRIRAATQHMSQLIDDLLQLSRVSRGELRSQNVDLSAIARRIVHDLRERHPGRSPVVEIEPGLLTRGDPRLLEVALRNLVENAWKFSSRNPEARIHVGRLSQDGEDVFFVQDNGAGFNMKYAGKLFRPFQRLHAPRDFEGTGIGLATVQRVLARHRGYVWAESEPGRGATFYFRIEA